MNRTTSLLAATAVVALGLSLAGCAPAAHEMTDAAPSPASPTPMHEMTPSAAPTTVAPAAGTVRQGTLAGSGAKTVTGTVTIDANTVEITGFHADEAPDLHFYLANGTDDAAATAGIEIGSVSSEATQIITLPEGLTTTMYTTLIVRCDKAKVVYGTAPLS